MSWQKQNDSLYQKFEFDNFTQALGFIQQVGDIAESMNHHPVIHNEYTTVELTLTTHDAGKTVTDKDHAMAQKIDNLAVFNEEVPLQNKRDYHAEVKMYADGGSRGNPGPSASGYVIMTLDDEILVEKGEYLGITTNNQAEYQAVRFGLEEAKHMNAQSVYIYLDSLLVVNQMIGKFKVKNRDLWPIHQAIKDLLPSFKKVTFTHIPRELNKLADAEVNKVLDAKANKH